MGSAVAHRLAGLHGVTTTLFGNLDDDLRAEIVSSLTWVRLRRGEVLFRKGDTADALYIVIHGRLQVLVDDEAKDPEVIAEIGRDEPVGEMALLTGARRSATVRAARDTNLIRLSSDAFKTVLSRTPSAILPIVRALADRLRSTTAGRRPPTRTATVAVVPLGSAEGLVLVVDGLIAGLEEFGTVLRLDAQAFDTIHGQDACRTPFDHPCSVYFVDWLNRQESDRDFVVFVGEREPTRWSERCIHHADLLLLVADGTDAPGLGRYGELLDGGRAPGARELVLVHPADCRRPTGTAAWLQTVGVRRHHHVRSDRPFHTRRLARFIAGRAVGVVLSGGGARGFAHAGVLRAIDESGIPIDVVGGVSMGSLAAACWAFEFDRDSTARAFREIFVKRIRPYTLPVISIFSTTKGFRQTQQMFEDVQIEDLWTSYFCVASNITRGRLSVLQTGSLVKCMNASGTIPGLFPPIVDNGELFVDGGLMTNLPVEIMRSLCSGPLIASDVGKEIELEVDPELDVSPSPWSLLWSRVNPWRRPVRFPGMGSILSRSMACREVSMKAERERLVTLYLNIPLDGIGLMEVEKVDEIIEAGYRLAVEKLRTIPPSIPRLSS